MAENDGHSPAAPPADSHSVLQERLSQASLDPNRDPAVQPFPRSPSLQRKMTQAAQPSQEQLSRCLEELQHENAKTAAHIQSLKKRRANLSKSTGAMKQRVREHFDSMRRVLEQDEQDLLESLELDLRQTRTKLDQVLQDWVHHQEQLSKHISRTQAVLNSKPEAERDGKTGRCENMRSKKAEASEQEIQLNEERLERILRFLSSISKQLKAQLRRKTLLTDMWPVQMDRQTCHGQIAVAPDGRGLSFSGSARSGPERPLQFDKVCCALGASPITAAQTYWEVDVRCCAAWAVGVAYASLERKGRNESAKLGRNRNSWCVELRNGRLSAWHNNLYVPCQEARQTRPGRVGVWVNYDKGQLMFYNADTMEVLQSFSAAVTTVFDRAHHQFTEPLYPAVRFLTPPDDQMWPNHLQLCCLTCS
ncbi:E3 ubiquitin-protein ligase TRIM39 isoform X1 [Takifugu rubripes]|uniref:Si:dkey-219e21.4 n=1 Tax=Takifugu rubripes TaxID=31033 RepID=A0A674MJ38_TAKRU|nr:E3 ubiquitin-protein ligase TRIM39-like isoform X1 [Takifugu rubripes]XP_029696207.1 E3 ubiquitin-protein ligase TRIM39-like isoform X1 [Takifugu rubripes]XP_029696208.1 E3 ubiquitin-protein ligase TRIM39-like isoform X1 [Takifugu rubripes]